MDTKELPQVDEASKRIIASLESAHWDDDPRDPISSLDIAEHIESLALENARLTSDKAFLLEQYRELQKRAIELSERGDRFAVMLEEDTSFALVHELRTQIATLEQECAQLREELASIDVTVSKSPSSRPPKGGA